MAPKKKAWELYDLKADRTESTNLMEKNPAKAADLKQKYNLWRT